LNPTISYTLIEDCVEVWIDSNILPCGLWCEILIDTLKDHFLQCYWSTTYHFRNFILAFVSPIKSLLMILC